ncbi:hypothetical protein ACHAWF_016661 [Thalassiosira exigua]
MLRNDPPPPLSPLGMSASRPLPPTLISFPPPGYGRITATDWKNLSCKRTKRIGANYLSSVLHSVRSQANPSRDDAPPGNASRFLHGGRSLARSPKRGRKIVTYATRTGEAAAISGPAQMRSPPQQTDFANSLDVPC